MSGLYISLAVLGLSAVDPVGIGIMPVLLAQEHPYRRVFAFLSGSFVSLMVAGVLFARGLGQATIRFEHNHPWFVPSAEAIAGVILLVIAITVYVQVKTGKVAVEPSGRTRRWLRLGSWQLFLLGALLVAVQSVVDVVFVIAMVHVGRLDLSGIATIAAVATYAITALMIQVAVVAAFTLAPSRQKAKTLAAVHTLLIKYSHQTVITVSLVLGIVLLALALAK